MASFAALTSCTLRMLAPLSNAMVLREIVPDKDSFGIELITLFTIDFLDTPTKIKEFNALNSFNDLISR